MRMRILIFGLSLFLILKSGCGTSPDSSENRFNVPALTNWHKESGVRIEGGVSTSTIRLSNGQYRIFYPGGDGIKSLISSDGLAFTQEGGFRVPQGSGSDYDAGDAKDPDLIAEDGFYRMYYTAVGADSKHRVMSATSTDGYTFTKEAGVRIDYSASYDQLADVQSAVKVSSSEYWMYFVYDWYGDNSIKGARSSDGLSWEVASLTGFSKNCMDPEVMLDDDGTLVMFVACARTNNSPEPMDIYKATSSNGIDWTFVGQALTPEKTEEGSAVGDPDIIRLPDNTYRIYYYGTTGPQEYKILSATAESL